MKYEIENYKGQLIEYDDDYDKFICEISIEDKFKTTKRLSLSDVRKEIDSFIKLNADFKPFRCLEIDKYDSKDFKIINVVAIRTDGKFVTYTNGNENYKSHSGKKDIKYWMEYDADLVEAKTKLEKEKSDAVSKCRDGIKELCKKLTPMDLSKYEHIINAE